MRQTHSIINFFTSGFYYAMEPGKEQDGTSADERWYVTTDWNSDFERHVLNPEIKEWLESYMHGRYRVAEQGLSGPETTWLRPIYFKHRADAMIFKMEWQGQTGTTRQWSSAECEGCDY